MHKKNLLVVIDTHRNIANNGMAAANQNLLSALIDCNVEFDVISDKDLLLKVGNILVKPSSLDTMLSKLPIINPKYRFLNKYRNILVVGWHTKIADLIMSEALKLSVSVHLYSHGVSIGNYEKSAKGALRFLMRLPFRFTMKWSIKKFVSCIFLSAEASGERNSDLSYAKKINKRIYIVPNFSDTNYSSGKKLNKEYDFVCIGYFSPIKNQRKLIEDIIEANIDKRILFIGNKEGSYYRSCVEAARMSKNQFIFLNDNQMDVKTALLKSKALISYSTTEVQPLTFIEALNFNIPILSKKLPELRHMTFVNFFENISDIKGEHYFEHNAADRFKFTYSKENHINAILAWVTDENIC